MTGPDDRLSNSLTAIADDVRRAGEAFEKAERDAIEHAMTTGRLLSEAREQGGHGSWLPFLERAGIAERKAQRLMKLHRGRLQSDTVSLLGGVSPALAFLRHREEAMRFFGLAEEAAIHLESTGEEMDERISAAQLIELAICNIEAMACMFPADLAGSGKYG